MTSLFQILKASKTGIAPDLWTALLGPRYAESQVPSEAHSWSDVRKIVRAGKAPELLPLGTYYSVWGDETSKAFDLVAYDKHFDPSLTAKGYTHSITLCERDLSETIQFDASEAWLYLEQALPAGTYRFKIPSYDTSYGGNKWYYFTFTAETPAGGQLVLSWPSSQFPQKMSSYSSSTSTTALNNVNLAEWIDGESPEAVDLGTCKLRASDPESTYGKINHIQRARYGSNNYYQSGARQFLNSDTAGGTWWQPTTIFNRPYSTRNTAGKLTQFSADLKAVLATPEIGYITNNTYEIGEKDGTPFTLQTPYTISTDKIFLLSHTEVNLSASPNIGTVLDAYVNAENADRIKKRTSNNQAYYWWLRAAYPSYANGVRIVSTSGALNDSYAYGSFGAPAACIIQ